MNTEIDKAITLMGHFEKKTPIHAGLNDLSEALFIISDIVGSGIDMRSAKRAENLLNSYRRSILQSLRKLISTPEEVPYADCDYWYSVLNEFIQCDVGNNDELLLLHPSVSKLREKARWESLSSKQRGEELYCLLMKLPKEKLDELARHLANRKKAF